eukprot:6422536-Pyramimonas_sp.AAC.1
MARRSAQEAPRVPQDAKRIPSGPKRAPRGTQDAEKPLRTAVYSPGRPFWMGWWGCAKRLDLHCFRAPEAT